MTRAETSAELRKELDAHWRAMPAQRLLDGGMVHGDVLRLQAATDAGQRWDEAAERLGDAQMLRAAAAAGMPASSSGIGNRSPIRPVEQTATSSTGQSSAAAVSSAIRAASAMPGSPVQAFAPPELSTTARRVPSATCRDQRTGAAWTRLLVKTAAAA